MAGTGTGVIRLELPKVCAGAGAVWLSIVREKSCRRLPLLNALLFTNSQFYSNTMQTARLASLAIITWAAAAVAQQDLAAKKRDEIRRIPQILDNLFRDYDSGIRPSPAEGEEFSSVLVTVNVYIVQSVFDGNTAEIDMYLRQEWVDARLTYTDQGISVLTVPRDKSVWVPDTYFMNAAETVKDPNKKLIRLEPEGFVLYSQMYTLKTECVPSAGAPFDNSKTCTFKMGSYMYRFEDVAHFWRKYLPVTNDPSPPSNTYKLAGSETRDCIGNYSTGTYSCIELELQYTGCAATGLVGVAVPSIALLLMSWAHFWVHRTWSVGRTASAALPLVAFSLALLFSVTAQSGAFASSGLAVWLLACVILTFLSLIEYFVVLCITGKCHTEEDVALLRERSVKCGGGNSVVVDRISRVLFPVLFIIFIIVYIIIYVA